MASPEYPEHPHVPELCDPSTLPFHRARLAALGLTIWELSVMETLMLSDGNGLHGWLHELGYDPRTIHRVSFTFPQVEDGTILLIGARARPPSQPWPNALFWKTVRGS